jgi:hypothetical protein
MKLLLVSMLAAATADLTLNLDAVMTMPMKFDAWVSEHSKTYANDERQAAFQAFVANDEIIAEVRFTPLCMR